MSVARRLLVWYRAHRRDLPWRASSDPYAVWISEAMLQQTQVATVIPYYQRFMVLFPTVEALAAADVGAVLKAWEGLGYYSRARNLHRAAAVVVDGHGGSLPGSLDGLKRLPGIGPYMAGAIGSIAFGLPVPVLDGNVERVLARRHRIGDPIKQSATRKRLWQLAGELVPKTGSGDFNQAMMELGATVCTPKNPSCDVCPVSGDCAAFAFGDAGSYPVKSAKKPVPHHDIAVGLVEKENRILLVRRPEKGLLGGLWEFPGGRVEGGEGVADSVVRQLAERFGLEVETGTGLPPVSHAFTHRKVTLHPFHCNVLGGRVARTYHAEHRWVRRSELAGYPLPRAHQHIVRELEQGDLDG
ncbi:MAG: A/G-specific adenine glycosylase [Leptospirillia bacterium]